MLKCSKCGTEFNDTKCPQCGSGYDFEKDWQLLTTVANDIEYEMIAGLLQMGSIPTIRKVKGIDGYLQIIFGMPIAGIDIYVPNDKFEEASALINSDVNEDEFLEEQSDK